jgi:hypothetical protein
MLVKPAQSRRDPRPPLDLGDSGGSGRATAAQSSSLTGACRLPPVLLGVLTCPVTNLIVQ